MKKEKKLKLSVAFPALEPVDQYDPAKIHFTQEYILLENIFSPLFEQVDQGKEIISGVAESFEWDQATKKYIIKIRKGHRTIDGDEIDAEDAAISLKRLIVLDGNTHGYLKNILSCPKLKSISDPCDQIQVLDKFTLALKTNKRSPFLIKMLSGVDFSIIPKKSLDKETLKIKDYRNTSGPYFFSSIDEVGNITLIANHNHYHYSSEIPQEVTLIKINSAKGANSLELYEKGVIDHITVVDYVGSSDLIEYYRNSNDSNIHITVPLNTMFVQFTPRGMKELSVEDRISYGKALKKAILPEFSERPGYEERIQLFPSMTEGHLKDHKEEEIRKKLNSVSFTKNGKGFKLSIPNSLRSQSIEERLKKTLPETKILYNIKEVVEQKNLPEDQDPHAIVVQVDVSFSEDINLISFLVRNGILGIKDRENWIQSYMKTQKKSRRLEMLRDAHYQALMEGVIHPIVSSPCTALYRNTWKANLPKNIGTNPLWLLTKN